VGWVRLLFVIKGFDDLSEVALPLAREWEKDAPAWRSLTLRMGQRLVEFARIGVLPNLRPDTVAEFGARQGFSRAEMMLFVDVGLAVKALPVLAIDAKKGDVSVQAVGILGRAVKDEKVASAVPLERWRQEALSNSAADLRAILDRRIEEIRTGAPSVVTLKVHVPEATRDKFRRARVLASRKARKWLTEGDPEEKGLHGKTAEKPVDSAASLPTRNAPGPPPGDRNGSVTYDGRGAMTERGPPV
jgi:hypothetical protein